MASSAIAVPQLSARDQDREERFHAFVREHEDVAVRMALRLVSGDYAAAQDVAQEAFLRAHRGLANFREESSLRTWFYRILVREAQRYARWQGVRRVWNTLSLSDIELPDRGRAVGDGALRDRLTRALAGLTQRQREALVLVHLEQFTVTETAELLGISVGSVKTHLHRALRAMRKELSDLHEPGAGLREDTP